MTMSLPSTADCGRIHPGAELADTTPGAGPTAPESAPAGPTHQIGRPSARGTAALTVAVLMAFGVILWGGYTQGWAWTGITAQDTLWHWLQLLLVPIAFAALPTLLRQHQAMRAERKMLMLGLTVAFVAFVIIGYAAPLTWTGFTGNTLWDWLSLLLLPIAITSVRFLRAERTITRVHYGIGAALLAVLGLLIVCGYLVPWSWTGFTGNTFVDWVQLLILPVLFPTVVVPATAAWLTATASRPKHRGGKQVAGPVDPH
jgi:MFS family permease